MAMDGRKFSPNNYRYGFNSKEKDDEVKGDGVQYDYGFRIYDARIAKFLSVDPLTKEYPFLSPYAFAEDQPIWAIDLDGLEKYIVHEKSFAPWYRFGEAFGNVYNGDNRGFSTSTATNAKVNTQYTVDFTKGTFGNKSAASSTTHQYDVSTGKEIRSGTATPAFDVWSFTGFLEGGTFIRIASRMEGQMPVKTAWAIPQFFNPPIIWSTDIKFENHTMDKNNPYLLVTNMIKGKGFPAFESFIEDANGTKVFIGTYTSPAQTEITDRLFGSASAVTQTVTTKLSTNQDGTINGVYQKDSNGNDIVVSPDAYNRQFTSAAPAADIKK